MSKEDMIEMTGMVNDVLPGNMFKVQVENTEHVLVCYLNQQGFLNLPLANELNESN